jgi:hypothetical protein
VGSAFAQKVYLAQTGELDVVVVGEVIDLAIGAG